MLVKSAIVDELGEDALLLPRRIEEALAANDRVKYCFALLLAAEAHAANPDSAVLDLTAERTAAGIDVTAWDQMVEESRRDADGSLLLPQAEAVRQQIMGDIATMLVPLSLAKTAGAKSFAERLAGFAASFPAFVDDRVADGIIGAMTSGDHQRGDSPHILVMDLHKALILLQEGLAVEVIEGAKVYGLLAEDRALVAAFMAGVAQTAPLKFEHPGLGTTATRVGSKLIIQNDIGETEAHVLVLHVEGLAATLTYTDIHLPRVEFFQSLFKAQSVEWQDTRTRHGERLAQGPSYYLCVGRFRATDRRELLRVLTFIGSRIVFLIDWNRARKRLRPFLPKADAVTALKWAADHDFGHRAFLKLGGEFLIYEAIEHAQPTSLHYGERLDEALGVEAAVGFVKFVLRACAEGLLQGRSERVIRDEVRAELVHYFKSTQEGLLAIAGEHAALIFELASALRDVMIEPLQGAGEPRIVRMAQRARKWERDADALVNRTRSLVRRARQPEIYVRLLREADDAADGLEEAAFLMTLLVPEALTDEVVEPLRQLAELLVSGAREMVKCLATASHVHRDSAHEDIQDFLVSVDRLITIEHDTDSVDRAVTAAIVKNAADFRQFHVLGALARSLEEAADALMRSALMLRDTLLNDMLAEQSR